MKRISILGSTGSIGKSALKFLAHHKQQFAVEALVAQQNVMALAEQAREAGAKLAVIADASKYDELKAALAGSGITCAAGEAGVAEAMKRKADMVVSAIVGAAGLQPTLAAIAAGSDIALANKECLVCAGALVMEAARKAGVAILPVDSEHNALFQVFTPGPAVEKLTLTASGGPFRLRKDLSNVTPEEAIKHPNWSMGAKISVDSATLMNKGLEVIEAFHLFPVSVAQIDVVVHPESIIHGLVHYTDGAVLAALSAPDMVTPLAYALSYPQRLSAPVAKLDLCALAKLTFEPVDHARFPALNLAYDALKAGGSATATLNAANELAVAAFLARRIGFTAITAVVAETLASLPAHAVSSLPDILETDRIAREKASSLIGSKYGMVA